MRTAFFVFITIILSPLALAQGVLNRQPYDSPQFLQLTHQSGFIRVLEFDWENGIFRILPDSVGASDNAIVGHFEHRGTAIEFWPVSGQGFKRQVQQFGSTLGWKNFYSNGDRPLDYLSEISTFTALRLNRAFQTPILEYAIARGLSPTGQNFSARPNYTDPMCSLERQQECTAHQICFAAAVWSASGSSWRGGLNAPWRVLAESRNLSCGVSTNGGPQESRPSDAPTTDDHSITIETPLEKEKTSDVAAREDWYFVEGNELHYFPDEILEDDYNELDQILRDHPDVDTLVLTSNGGYFSYAMDIVQVVFDYQLNTKADIMCYSACTFILLAGEERSLTRGARVGFHQSYWEAEDIEEYYLEYQDEYESVYDFVADEIEFAKTDAYEEISFMIEQGVDPAFAAKAVLSTPGDDMWYPKASELLAANVITK